MSRIEEIRKVVKMQQDGLPVYFTIEDINYLLAHIDSLNGKALDIYSEHKARVEMAKKINNGDFVVKKKK